MTILTQTVFNPINIYSERYKYIGYICDIPNETAVHATQYKPNLKQVAINPINSHRNPLILKQIILCKLYIRETDGHSTKHISSHIFQKIT